MSKKIFVNLPVADLATSTEFYTAIGFTLNEQFSDGVTSAAMVLTDDVTVQLHTHDHFAGFTTKDIADAKQSCEVMLGVSCDSREGVDSFAAAAAANGGHADVRPAQDMGWLYSRAVADPDGHHFEAIWLDMAAAG